VTQNCYHCGLPVPSGSKFSTLIFNEPHAMCCHGCQAVAESIVDNGLEQYYQYRTELPKTAEDLIPEELKQLDLYDRPEVQKSFVLDMTGSIREASLILEGITCAACIWLNERHLKQLKGVKTVSFNYAAQRARVSWDETEIKLSNILAEIRKLGYHAHPFSAQQQDILRKIRHKAEFRRLAVAGLSAAQVMMIAVALYAGPEQGLEYASAELLRWFSLVMTLPAISYSAWPFYRSAWRGLINRNLGMDVPITLGVLAGFVGSVWATLAGHGHVYFDTITMLIFFLLVTRFLERSAREKSIEAAENLLRLLPAMATKITQGEQSLVAVIDLQVGDIILVKPGETIAADALVESGDSSVDESLLTGESRALAKSTGDQVYAGSINYESPLTLQINAIAEDTRLAGITRLLDRAQAEKPKLAELANRIAVWFTSALLMVVLIVAVVWWQIDPERVLEIVLTVLVVSCPCALSLAAPAAFAAAGSHLVKRGVLMTRGHALETLAKVTHFVFDKTGTLTVGKPVLTNTITYTKLSAQECLKIAASMESHSEHPIASSFIEATKQQDMYPVSDIRNIPGQGLQATVEDKIYSLGNKRLIGDAPAIQTNAATVVYLSHERELLAAFVLQDQPRAMAHELVQELQNLGYKTSILSGDSTDAVTQFARFIGVNDFVAELSPEQKLSSLKAFQSDGAVVAVIGDGINDAPVLAGAQVSIAMGGGTQMARASGDIVLLGDNLMEISHAVATSRFAMRVIKQNFIWALGYNLVALPFAALGLISPLMAAIGMSVSSLVVVLNALRLR